MENRGSDGLLARLRRRGAAVLGSVSLPTALAAGGLYPTELATRVDLETPASAVAPSLPLHLNPDVDRWMARFRTTERDAFDRLLHRQGVYGELIRTALRARGMPEELQYLAMLESGLSNRAVSAAAATGLWQIMEGTAQELGLRVDEWVDERRDPVRATDAALDYLDFLHDRYGSWYLAAAAYNAGPGKVDGVLRRHAGGRSGDENLYWEVVEHLPRETQEYVPRLVAATLVAESPDRETSMASPADAYRYDRVFVPGGTSLGHVAWLLKLQPRVLTGLNRHLLQGVTPPGETYPIRVPPGRSQELVATLGRRSRS